MLRDQHPPVVGRPAPGRPFISPEEAPSEVLLAEATDFANDPLWRRIDSKFERAVSQADTFGLSCDVRYDIKQQCLLAFIRGIRGGRFENQRSFRNWRVQTARNLVLKYVREQSVRSRHRDKLARVYGSRAVQGEPSMSPAPEQVVALALGRLKKTLTRPVLNAAMMRFVEGVSYSTIALRCSCTEPAARQRVRRARQAMIEILAALSVD